MSQPSLEVFRLVALRGPNTDLSTSPVEHVRGSGNVRHVHKVASALAATGWRPATEDIAGEIRELQAPYPAAVLRSELPWFALAEEYANEKGRDPSQVKVNPEDGQEMTLREYALSVEFDKEQASLTRSG
jgi:hypothetical protein